MENSCFMGTEFQFGKIKGVLELCTVVIIHNKVNVLNINELYFKITEIENFILWKLYNFKNSKERVFLVKKLSNPGLYHQ